MAKLTKNDLMQIKWALNERHRYHDLYTAHCKIASNYRNMKKTCSHQSLADKFNVSKSAIQKIADGDNYSEV